MTDAAITVFVNTHDGLIGIVAGIVALIVVGYLFWFGDQATS